MGSWKEEFEKGLRAGLNKAGLFAAVGMAYNSKLYYQRLRKEYPGCITVNDVRERLGLQTTQYGLSPRSIRHNPQGLLELQRRKLLIEKIAAENAWLLAHTCLMPLGWQPKMLRTGSYEFWMNSDRYRELAESCLECQKNGYTLRERHEANRKGKPLQTKVDIE